MGQTEDALLWVESTTGFRLKGANTLRGAPPVPVKQPVGRRVRWTAASG